MVKSFGRNVEKSGLKRGPWTPEEDRKLLTYLLQNGYGSWSSLSQKAGLQRCGKSCRLRWNNYLNPEIKRGNFSLHEEQTIIRLHALLGNKWAAIAANLPRRTDNEIKNHWNTHLKKRLAKMGIDPVTHKSSHIPSNHHQRNNTTTATATNLISHMAQWESARLEAEARFGKETNNLNNVIKPYKNGPPQLLSHNNNNNNINNNGPPRCLDILTAWQNMCSSANHAATAISGGGCGGGGGGVGFGFNFGGGDLESPTSIFKCSEGENFGKRNINIIGGNNLVVSAVSAVGGGGGGGGGLALHHHDQDQDHQVEDNDLIYDFSNKFWWDDIATMLDCELPNAPL